MYLRLFIPTLVVGCLMIGCDVEQASPRPSSPDRRGTKPKQTSVSRPKPTVEKRRPKPQKPTPHAEDSNETTSDSNEPERPERHTLADTLNRPDDSPGRWVDDAPRLWIDEHKVAAANIRKLQSKRLTLYTDLPKSDEIDRLPEIFDQAFAQWCDYFDVDPSKKPDWRLTGFLMKDKVRFFNAGLLPPSLPPFKNGYAQNFEFWLYDQTSEYYRRHLFLHEGTHGFMNTMLGACGPPWYMEGIAEYLSTHLWNGKRLTLGYLPTDDEEVPGWGRIRLVKEAIADGRPLRLQDVINYSYSAHLETEPYAWCWALTMLLDRHPRYQKRFRTLHKYVLNPDFNARFRTLMADDWQPLCEEWQVLATGLDYNYDVPATAFDFTPGRPMAVNNAEVSVDTKRGWQNSGIRLEAGVTYDIRAKGRYQVADKPQIWWSEPGGVSIRYYQGRPLGLLLAAMRPDQPEANSTTGLLRSASIGLGRTLTPPQAGTLYFRINDSAGELDDNEGQATVTIRRVK